MFSKKTRFEKLLEAVPDALVGMDQEGVIRFVNYQTESLFGFDRDELIGQRIETLVPEPLWQIYAQNREQYFADPRTRSSGLDLELSGRHHNRGEFPINVSMCHIDTGDVLLVITGAGDVARQQQAVKKAALAAAIVEYSDDAIIGNTLGGTITSWNPAAERMYGYSSKKIIGRSLSLLVPKDRVGELTAAWAKIQAGEPVEHLETIRVRKDGTMVSVSVTVAPIRNEDGAIVGASAVHRDVTAQRQAFQAAQRLAAIVESSDDAIIGFTLDGIVMSWNAAAEKMYGYSSQEAIGTSVLGRTPEDRIDEIKSIVANVRAGRYGEHHETERIRKDGTVVPVSFTISPIRDANGAVVGASTTARDMSELQQAAQYARSLIETGLDPLMTISPEGAITDVNEAASRVTGIPRDKVIGTDFSQYFTEPDKALETYQRAFTQCSVTDYPLTLRHRDGTLTDLACNASVYRDLNGAVLGVSVVGRDVTQQKRTEQVVQQDRDLLRATMDSLLDPHVLLEAVRDEAGQIVDFVFADANPAACEYAQKTYDELIGMRLLDLFHNGAQPGSLVDEYRRAIENGGSLVLDDVVYTCELTGEERHFDIRAACVGDGLSYGWRDVTDRHAAAQWLAESEEYYRLLAENASDVVMRLGPDRRYEWVSGSIADVLGWAAPDLLGHRIDEFIHPEDLALFRHAVADASPESTASTEFRFRRSDGSYRWVLCHTRLKLDEDGAPVVLVGGLVDIEARKGVEAQEIDRLVTLERLQRLAVGRELKMIELKKEIESLRSLVHGDGDENDDKH